MPPSSEIVVIVGASDQPDRSAHQAMLALEKHGHTPGLVHPRLLEIQGRPVRPSLDCVSPPVDTVTLYVNPAVSTPMAGALIALNPKRVLFNPGTENPPLSAALQNAGITTEDACTLVLLARHAF